VYVLDDGSNYGAGTADHARRELGAKVAGTGHLPSDPALDDVARATPDAIYFGGTPVEVPRVLDALRAQGITVPVVGPDALHDPAFAQRTGPAADGFAVTCLCTGIPPASFGTSPVTAYAYDAANVFLAGIADGADTRADMLRYVNGSRTDGVMGHYRFRADGELASINVAILTIQRRGFTNTVRIPVR
jgi:branched-chain amino acid transport system substrate-binding protein